MERPPVIVIVGPTASGKSSVAQEVAKACSGEIVSADSMQIYRDMDIGTGKVTAPEQEVPHWGIDILDPGEPYSAALFQTYARECFESIWARSNQPILAGGTGFYVRAAIDDYQFAAGEQVDNPVRTYYQNLAEHKGDQAVWDELHAQDPQSAALIHPHNLKRVIRALELVSEGDSYAQRKEALDSLPQAIPARFFGLAVERDILNQRIDDRIDAMVQEGLVEEVQCLLNQGFRTALTASQAIGYKEIVAALEGSCTLEEAIESIKISTHRYAKRQRSWFNADKRITWIDANDSNTQRIASDVLTQIR